MLSYIDNFIIFKNIKMKTFKFYSILLLFVLCFNSSYACDLLDIEIGENKSSLENIFGEIPESRYLEGDNKRVNLISKITHQVDGFCEDRDVFGNVLMHAYIVDNTVGAFELEVLGKSKSKDGKENNSDLLNKYVQLNFGEINTEDKSWPGYKFWDVGNKYIYYYKIKQLDNTVDEGVVVTSHEYFDVLSSNEDINELPE